MSVASFETGPGISVAKGWTAFVCALIIRPGMGILMDAFRHKPKPFPDISTIFLIGVTWALEGRVGEEKEEISDLPLPFIIIRWVWKCPQDTNIAPMPCQESPLLIFERCMHVRSTLWGLRGDGTYFLFSLWSTSIRFLSMDGLRFFWNLCWWIWDSLSLRSKSNKPSM